MHPTTPQIIQLICICMALQTALLVSTSLSYLLSAGQLTVNVLLLLLLSAAVRYTELLWKNKPARY